MEDFVYDHTGVVFGVGVLILLATIFGATFINWNTGEKQYTGYIYSAEDDISKTIGHLRFSENAGMDEQPSFCVNIEDGQQVKDLAGSGKKVRVTVPKGFKLVAPWACAFPAHIEEMGE